MDIKDYKRRLRAVLDLLQRQAELIDNIMVAAGRTLYVEFVNRVFVLGQDFDGSAIGKYSTKPNYFSPNQVGAAGVPKPRIALPRTRIAKGGRVPSLSPVGQKGQTVFKNGKPHKTAYLKSGYAEFRKAYGRQNKTVDLNLTGSLFLSIQIAKTKRGIALFFATQGEAKKAEGAELRFGKVIFRINPKEKDIFDKEIRRIIALIVNKIMQGQTI